MRLPTSLRGAVVALALVATAGCGDDSSGPSCPPFVVDEIFLSFPVYAPGAALPFADARLRQVYYDYADARCPAPFAQTYLSYAPLVPLAVQFGYTLQFLEPDYSWFYSGEVQLLGGPSPTNEVTVSYETFPIDQGAFELTFDYFDPL